MISVVLDVMLAVVTIYIALKSTQKLNLGRPRRVIISHSHKPTKATTMCLQLWRQPLETYLVPHATAWDIILGIESKSCGAMALQKEMSQTMGLIFETTS